MKKLFKVVQEPLPLVWFNIFSFAAAFAVTLALFRKGGKSFFFSAALALVLFILLGLFALPGFFLGAGAAVFLGRKNEGARRKNRTANSKKRLR